MCPTSYHPLLIVLACSACAGGPEYVSGAPTTAQRAAVETPARAFAAFPCAPGASGDSPPELELRHRGDALLPAIAVDYLVVRRLVRTSWSQLASIAQRGEPCTRARRADVCRDELERLDAQFSAHPSASCPGLECPGFSYVLTTDGDRAAAWSTAPELRRLLGPIDTASEAWLMAQVAERAGPYLCGDAEFAAQRPIPGGFELRERRFTRHCRPLELSEIVYRVTTHGAVTASARSVVRSEPDGCTSSGHDVVGPTSLWIQLLDRQAIVRLQHSDRRRASDLLDHDGVVTGRLRTVGWYGIGALCRALDPPRARSPIQGVAHAKGVGKLVARAVGER